MPSIRWPFQRSGSVIRRSAYGACGTGSRVAAITASALATSLSSDPDPCLRVSTSAASSSFTALSAVVVFRVNVRTPSFSAGMFAFSHVVCLPARSTLWLVFRGRPAQRYRRPQRLSHLLCSLQSPDVSSHRRRDPARRDPPTAVRCRLGFRGVYGLPPAATRGVVRSASGSAGRPWLRTFLPSVRRCRSGPIPAGWPGSIIWIRGRFLPVVGVCLGPRPPIQTGRSTPASSVSALR